MTRLVVGCNYHTTWQSHKAMRFELTALYPSINKAKLETRTTGKSFFTSIDDLIFIESDHNIKKADRLEGRNEILNESKL